MGFLFNDPRKSRRELSSSILPKPSPFPASYHTYPTIGEHLFVYFCFCYLFLLFFLLFFCEPGQRPSVYPIIRVLFPFPLASQISAFVLVLVCDIAIRACALGLLFVSVTCFFLFGFGFLLSVGISRLLAVEYDNELWRYAGIYLPDGSFFSLFPKF